MGKKGRWFSAIKRVFTPQSKDRPENGPEKTSSKEKKKKGHGNSFIPLFREPSSIEDILGEAEREQSVIFRSPIPPQQPKTPSFVSPIASSPRGPTPRAASPRVTSPRVAVPSRLSPRVASPKAASPRAASPSVVHHHREISYKQEPATSRSQLDSATRIQTASPRASSPSIAYRHKEISYRPQPTLRTQHVSATKIQAVYRGYTARRSYRALKGLVRLQGVVRGQNVQRQTMNAMKYMQLLVRVQSQIQLRRIQMLEGQAQHKSDKDLDGSLNKWSQASEAGNHGEWDDSQLTKDEIEARLQRKVEAVVKRERAMSYAYSHQPWKSTPRSAKTDARTGGFPLWWTWLERQLPTTTNTPENQPLRNFQLTPPRPYSELRASPWPQSSNQNLDALTPKSSKSSVAIPSRLARTPPSSRTPPANKRYSRGSRASGAESPFGLPLKDDDSLTSCPPFSAPSYMNPTVSAKAKVRASSNPKERIPGTPGSESTRRHSFPFKQGIVGSFKWNKGSFFSGKSSGSQRAIDKNRPLHSIGNMSIDSAVSSPAGVGRKPFNRYV